MIKLKKTAIFILIILTLCLPLTKGFASEASAEDISQVMKSLNIMSGYPDGSLHLEDKVTRAQFAKIIISASKYRNSVSLKSTTSPFRDVAYSSWEAPYISIASINGLIKGYPDSSFKPEKNVTLEEAVTVALTMMGYTGDDFGSSWPYGQLSLAANSGLLKNCSAQAGAELTRRDTMQIVYNMLSGNTKDGSRYISSIGYKLLEDVVLIASDKEDSSVGSGKILTSQGSYKISEAFNTGNVGRKGNAILNSNEEIICFIPSDMNVLTYTAYAVLNNDIIAADAGGYTEALGLSENTTIYYKGEKTTLQNAVSKINAGDILKVSSSGGSIDFVVVSGNKTEGPLTASGSNYLSYFNIDPANTTVLRNGSKGSLSDINANDILYYSQSLNTLWAYSRTVTGVYESAAPNRDQPSSIMVSGNSYIIESESAFNKLSSKGSFNIGDSVTLLLGKDGKIADVLNPSDNKINVVGYLTKSGTKEVTNSAGYKYSSNYVQIVTTDGDVLEYEAGKNYSSILNSVVSVKFSNGLAVLSRVSATGLYGTFDWGNKKLGSMMIAEDIKIMDVGTVDSSYSPSYAITYPQRVNNVEMDSENVLYYSKNGNGEINNLILKNATGDTMKYGIVTKASATEEEMSVSSSYVCDINGSTVNVTKNNSVYTNVKAGQPAAFEMSNNSVQTIKPLTAVSSSVSAINEVQLETVKGEKYLLSGDVVVYEYNGSYKIIPLSEVIGNSSYTVRAYYDKLESRGGRVRVIVVSAK